MLNIKSIPAFQDNYIWVIQNQEQHCVIVDPGDAQAVLSFLKTHQLLPDAILITHYHADHTGGISELVRHFPRINVVGPASEAIPSLTHPVKAGEQIEIFDHLFEILDLKGHTPGHIGYFNERRLFCGDALFSAGCGRVANGLYKEMWQSLQTIKALPEDTLIYCAHEYTAANIAFALAVEPENTDLLHYREQVNRLRAHDQATIPSYIEREKKINPFLRTEQPEVIKSVSDRTTAHDSFAVFTALRQWKNDF